MKRDSFILDEMTPLERAKAIKEGKNVDRLPCSPSLGEQPTRLIGVSVSKYLNCPKTMAEAQIEAFKRYGQDGVGVGPDQYALIEALGAKMKYFDDNIPQVDEAFVKNIEDIKKIKEIDFSKDGRFPIYLEALEIIREEIGTFVKVGTGIGGPFTTAVLLSGMGRFFRDIRQNPEFIHKLLEITTENILAYMEVCFKKGFSVSIGEPFASNSVISPIQFRKFALPYLKKIGEWFWNKTNKGYSLHICGKTKAIWPDLLDIGIGSFSLDNAEDLFEAKEIIGDKIALKGNVPPVDIMLHGSAKDVKEASRNCIIKAYDNPKGFTLGTGCRLPLDTKERNVIALMDSARLYGKMPIKIGF